MEMRNLSSKARRNPDDSALQTKLTAAKALQDDIQAKMLFLTSSGAEDSTDTVG